MNDICLVYEKGAFSPIRIDYFLKVSHGWFWTTFHGTFKTVVIRTHLIEKYIIKKGEIIDGEET